jgi:hypothetical protein
MALPEEPKEIVRTPTPHLALSIHHFTRLVAQRAEAEAKGVPFAVFEDARQGEAVEAAFVAFQAWRKLWP